MGKLGWVMVKIFNGASVVFAMVESSIFGNLGDGDQGKEKSTLISLEILYASFTQFLVRVRQVGGLFPNPKSDLIALR